MDDLIEKFEDWAADRGGVRVSTPERLQWTFDVRTNRIVPFINHLVDQGLAVWGYAVEDEGSLLDGFYEWIEQVPKTVTDRFGRLKETDDAHVVTAFSLTDEFLVRIEARRKDPVKVITRLRKSGRLGDWGTVEQVRKASALPQEVIQKYLDDLVSEGKAVKKVRVSESEVTECYVVDGVDYSCPLGMGRFYVPSERISWSRDVEYGYRFLDSEGKSDG
jgi:hypothetical protein